MMVRSLSTKDGKTVVLPCLSLVAPTVNTFVKSLGAVESLNGNILY